MSFLKRNKSGSDDEELELGEGSTLFGLKAAVSLDADSPTAFIGESAESRKLLFVPGLEDDEEEDKDGKKKRTVRRKRKKSSVFYPVDVASTTITSSVPVTLADGKTPIEFDDHNGFASSKSLLPERHHEEEDKDFKDLTPFQKTVVPLFPKVICFMQSCIQTVIRCFLPVFYFYMTQGCYYILLSLDAFILFAAEPFWQLFVSHFHLYALTQTLGNIFVVMGSFVASAIILGHSGTTESYLDDNRIVPLHSVIQATIPLGIGTACYRPVYEKVTNVMTKSVFSNQIFKALGSLFFGSILATVLPMINVLKIIESTRHFFVLVGVMACLLAIVFDVFYLPCRSFFLKRKDALFRIKMDKVNMRKRLQRSIKRGKVGPIDSSETCTQTVRIVTDDNFNQTKKVLINSTFFVYLLVVFFSGFSYGCMNVRSPYYMLYESNLFHFSQPIVGMIGAFMFFNTINELLVVVANKYLFSKIRLETVTVILLCGIALVSSSYVMCMNDHSFALIGEFLAGSFNYALLDIHILAIAETYEYINFDGFIRTLLRAVAGFGGVCGATIPLYLGTHLHASFGVSAFVIAIVLVLFVLEMFLSRKRSRETDFSRRSALKSSASLSKSEDRSSKKAKEEKEEQQEQPILDEQEKERSAPKNCEDLETSSVDHAVSTVSQGYKPPEL